MLRRLFFCLVLLTLCPALAAHAAGTTLTWYGQSAFRIVTPQGHVIFIDPWLTNPANRHGKEDLAAVQKADLILVTHGHFDHVGDSIEIAKRTGAHLVASTDLGAAMVASLGFPREQADLSTLGNAGGTVHLLGGEVSVTFEPAVHGSTVTDSTQNLHGAGNPGGFVIRIKDGPSFYHTGDTAAFGDMKILGQEDHIHVMMVCIGDHFTMGPMDAAMATGWVHPDIVIPMHYGTFPALTGTPDAFARALRAHHVTSHLRVLTPGESIKL